MGFFKINNDNDDERQNMTIFVPLREQNVWTLGSMGFGDCPISTLFVFREPPPPLVARSLAAVSGPAGPRPGLSLRTPLGLGVGEGSDSPPYYPYCEFGNHALKPQNTT